jgi:hypothetical protein
MPWLEARQCLQMQKHCMLHIVNAAANATQSRQDLFPTKNCGTFIQGWVGAQLQ